MKIIIIGDNNTEVDVLSTLVKRSLSMLKVVDITPIIKEREEEPCK